MIADFKNDSPVHCNGVADLPPPPPGRTGWPWTEDAQNRSTSQDPFPRISIVTPSYNQGAYIEETIRSILLQGYPDLEYIILDGGSTDQTLDVIRKYQRWINYWHSAPDGGQAEAINTGFAMISGSVANWVNSDDVLLPGALHLIAAKFEGGPVVGSILKGETPESVTEEGFPGISAAAILRQRTLPQPAIWMPVKDMARAGKLITTYHFSFDVEYLIRLFAIAPPPTYTDAPLVFFRLHEKSKSVSQSRGFLLESRSIVRKWRENHSEPELQRIARQVHRRVSHHNMLLRLRYRHRLSYVRRLYMGMITVVRYRRIDRFVIGALTRMLINSK